MADRRRSPHGAPRTRAVRTCLSEAEYAEIVAAATGTGLAPGAFIAETTLAVARGEIPLGATPRDVLEALLKATVPVVRSGTALERAVAQAEATGQATDRLESIVAECRRTLRDLDEAARVARKTTVGRRRQRPHDLNRAAEGAAKWIH